MKNLFKKGLSVLFVAALVCTMASCGGDKETSSAADASSQVTSEATSEAASEVTSEATSEATDSDKAEFSNGYVSFNYPASFTKSEESGITVLTDEATRDNISITVEDETNQYDTMTKEAFEAQLALQGMDVELQEYENEELELADGTKARAINYKCEYMGINMEQALVIATAKGKTSSVTLTIVSGNDDWALDVLSSLKFAK